MALEPDQEQFARDAYTSATRVVERGDEWMAAWIAGIACLESGWGRSVPDYAGRSSHSYIGYHWFTGLRWSGRFALSREGGTGKKVRYRVFDSIDDCMRALYWLMKRSRFYSKQRERFKGHMVDVVGCLQQARELLRAMAEKEQELARVMFVMGFSETYCPADPNHGPKVVGLMGEVERVVESVSSPRSAATDG